MWKINVPPVVVSCEQFNQDMLLQALFLCISGIHMRQNINI